MKPLRAGAIFAALSIMAALLLIWEPWDGCDAPEELCAAAQQLEQLDGIEKAEVDYEVTLADPKDGDASRASWTVVLSDELSPSAAGNLAQQASAQLEDFSGTRRNMHSILRFAAGVPEPSGVPGTDLYPVDVMDSGNVREQIIEAFAFRQLGAARATQGAAVAESTGKLLELGEFAASRGSQTSLELADGSVRYTPNGDFKAAELALAVEAAGLPQVQSAIFGSGQLSVHTISAEESTLTEQVRQWLDAHEPLAEPTRYTLSSPGYGRILEGWIAGKKPAPLIPTPAPLPEAESPWPQDAAAPACSEADLQISLGSPDAAAGTRYLAVYARNASAAPCALQSYPRIEFLNASGEAQPEVQLQPRPGMSLERLVVPAGETALSTLQWGAMSTALDPDETVLLEVSAAPGHEAVSLQPEIQGAAAPLDILDGAEVHQSPWVQALEGWSKPAS